MKIKDFELDLPTAERELRIDFRQRTRCVSAHYGRCFPGLTVQDCWKVLIECVDKVEKQDVRNLLGVFVLQMDFAYEDYLAKSPIDRKRAALEVLHSGACRIAGIKGWPITPFETARTCVLDQGLKNEWQSKKQTSSPDRSLKALLTYSHDSDRFRAWLVVVDKEGKEVSKEIAVEEEPIEFIFVPKLGKLKWVSKNQVVLMDKKGQEIKSVMT